MKVSPPQCRPRKNENPRTATAHPTVVLASEASRSHTEAGGFKRARLDRWLDGTVRNVISDDCGDTAVIRR